MAIDTYLALQAKIADWLNRADLTAQITDFISLFEARANRELRTHDMVKRSTSTVNFGYLDVPPDWLETIALMRLTNQPRRLRFVSVEDSFEYREKNDTQCQTEVYTQMDGKFFLYPAPTDYIQLELIYRGKVPALSSNIVSGGADTGVTTNWLLQKSPDLYLYGSLAEAEPYLKNDERVQLWQSKTDSILSAMQAEADRASFPQGALTVTRKTFG